jgi:peptidoglycan/LPS O-acetylase OafA/YrhL
VVATAPADGRRLESLTSLRFFAAFAVFAFHVPIVFPLGSASTSIESMFSSGLVGVSFFFVLSGFVLTWTHRAGDSPSAFWRRRVARIAPNHVVAWFIALAVVLLVEHDTVPLRGAGAAFLLVQAWVPYQWVYFAVNAVLWSLSCEVFFYLVFPWLIAVVSRIPPRLRRVAMVAVVVTLVVWALAATAMFDAERMHWAVYIFPPARLLEFVLGMLLALELRAGTWPTMSPVGPAVATAAAFVLAQHTPDALTYVSVTVVPFTLLIGAAAQADLAGRPSPLRRPVLVTLGHWSYAFYLLHALVLRAAFELEPSMDGIKGWGWVAVLLAVSIAASGVLYTLVERPLERRLRAPSTSRAPAAPAPVLPSATAAYDGASPREATVVD